MELHLTVAQLPGYDLELGSGSFIGASGDYQGFEDQIVGHNTGEEFDITVQFPENYQSSDLAENRRISTLY